MKKQFLVVMKRLYVLLLLCISISTVYGQRNLTEDEWDNLDITKPIILEFYANWCAPCKQQATIVSQLAREFPDIEFYKVNIDREKDWFSYVTRDGAIPMIQFIYKKDERNNFYSRATISGFMPYNEMRDSCSSILKQFNEVQRKKNIPQRISSSSTDTIIDIDGIKYHLGLSGAIDMGTSVLWAAYNVGAHIPNEMGEYYSWGEIDPKRVYEWNTYKYAYPNDSENLRFKKYGPKIDRFDRLQVSDDVAKQKWGGNWRLPLREEFVELIDNTKWKEFDLRGVYGCIAYSEKTKNAIFFPLAGCKTDQGLVEVEASANMWAMDMLYTENSYFDYYEYPKFAYALVIDEQVSVQKWARFMGFSIRPVIDVKYNY